MDAPDAAEAMLQVREQLLVPSALHCSCDSSLLVHCKIGRPIGLQNHCLRQLLRRRQRQQQQQQVPEHWALASRANAAARLLMGAQVLHRTCSSLQTKLPPGCRRPPSSAGSAPAHAALVFSHLLWGPSRCLQAPARAACTARCCCWMQHVPAGRVRQRPCSLGVRGCQELTHKLRGSRARCPCLRRLPALQLGDV